MKSLLTKEQLAQAQQIAGFATFIQVTDTRRFHRSQLFRL